MPGMPLPPGLVPALFQLDGLQMWDEGLEIVKNQPTGMGVVGPLDQEVLGARLVADEEQMAGRASMPSGGCGRKAMAGAS